MWRQTRRILQKYNNNNNFYSVSSLVRQRKEENKNLYSTSTADGAANLPNQADVVIIGKQLLSIKNII